MLDALWLANESITSYVFSVGGAASPHEKELRMDVSYLLPIAWAVNTEEFLIFFVTCLVPLFVRRLYCNKVPELRSKMPFVSTAVAGCPASELSAKDSRLDYDHEKYEQQEEKAAALAVLPGFQDATKDAELQNRPFASLELWSSSDKAENGLPAYSTCVSDSPAVTCATTDSCLPGEWSPASTASATVATATALCREGAGRYALLGEAIGGGTAGLVQSGVCLESSRAVAVKTVSSDEACPVRFVELGPIEGAAKALHFEGFAPVNRSCSMACQGALHYDVANRYAAEPFAPESLEACIVLVQRGGGVTFAAKIANVHAGGASGVLFVNTTDRLENYNVGDSEQWLPSVLLTESDGAAAIAALEAAQADIFVEVRNDLSHELMLCRQIPPHPHIVEVLDAWEDPCGGAKIVMERCVGHLAPGQVQDVSTALRLLRHMLLGIAHLHMHGICHRDVKPGNLLLTKPISEPDFCLVLSDFSMATMARRMRVPCGSVRYLAPEVLIGEYGFERDLWSVGVVAFELIFGRHPFGVGLLGPDREVLRQLERNEPIEVPEFAPPLQGDGRETGERLPEVPEFAPVTLDKDSQRRNMGERLPEGLRELLRALLRRDPSARPSAVKALAHPCLACTSDGE